MQSVEFGKYLLVEQIGVGRMAQLWKAKAVGVKGLEKFIAVKRLLPHLSTEKAVTGLFIQEAKKIIQLRHPNVVQSYDYGSVEGTPYLASEFVEGKDLRRVMEAVRSKGQALSIEDSLYIIGEVCKALQYAHSVTESDESDQKIIHAGIRPQNILITYDGFIKVSDFCISRAFYDGVDERIDALKQSAPYLSPELVQGRTLEQRSDIFCLGIVLFELLTGNQWLDGDPQEIINRLEDDAFEPAETVPEDLPPPLQGILKRCLGRERELRYPSAGQMLSEIDKIKGDMQVRSDATTFGEYMRSIFSEEIEAERASYERMEWANATVQFVSEGGGASDSEEQEGPGGGIWKHKKFIASGVGLLILILVVLLVFLPGNKHQSEKKERPEAELAKTEQDTSGKVQEPTTEGIELTESESPIPQKEVLEESVGGGVKEQVASQEVMQAGTEQQIPTKETAIDAAIRKRIDKGLQALDEEKYSEAIKIFDQLLKEDGSLKAEIALPYSRALEGRALQLEDKKPKTAEKLFLKALEFNPESVDAHYHLGLIYVGGKRYKKAIEHYKKVVDIDDQYADAYFNLGYVYAVTKQYKMAEDAYQKVVTLAPPYLDEALFNLAMVQKRLGKRESCIENLKRAIIVNPNNKLAKQYLEKLKAK